MAQPSPEVYYQVLHRLLLELFGHDWHLGYWLNAKNPAEAAHRLNEIMADRLPADSGMAILDVGCGVGGPACDIAERAGGHVTGLSNSRPGLEEAERFARERGLHSRVDFKFGEALGMPFPDNTFDAVISCEAIHNIQDKAALAREVARVLKPGGTVVVGDLFLLKQPENLQRLKQFSFHLVTADEMIETLQAQGILVHESISIGHHVGPKGPEISAQICRERAAQCEPGSLERLILERSVEATALLAEEFRLSQVSWGIWSGRKNS